MSIGDVENAAREALLSAQKTRIKSILTTGLQEGRDIRKSSSLTSFSSSPSVNRVDGVVVNPEFHLDKGVPRLPSGDSFRLLNRDEEAMDLRKLMLNDVLHRGNSSVFGVIIERASEYVDQLARLSEEELRARTSSSILVVVPLEDVHRTNDLQRDKLEYPVQPPVLPNVFSHVFIPIQLRQIFDSVLSEIEFDSNRIIPVDTVERVLFIPRIIKVGTIEDVDTETHTSLQVPNYYQGLENLTRLNGLKPYWIHGVRLPTQNDLMHK